MNTTVNQEFTPVVDQRILDANRSITNAYGRFFGLNLFTIEATDVFSNYKKDKESGKYVLLRCPQFYTAKSIRITAIDLITLGNPNDIRVQLNKDIKLRFQLAEPKHREPNYDTVSLAIKHAVEGLEPIYFSDIVRLNQELQSYNRATADALSEFADNVLNASQMVENVIGCETTKTEDYVKQTEGIDYPTERMFAKNKADVNITVDVQS